MFAKIQRVHFVGIGGIGMSGIAEVLLNLGYKVSGSDLKPSPVTQRLARMGAVDLSEHRPENVAGAEVVIVSSAITRDNAEVVAAHEQHIPVIQRAEMLAELMRLKYGIAIAGMHGKTTTTSMVAAVLAAGGLDPTVVVGGRVDAMGSNARLGKSQYLVAEADESDRSFLKLSPILAVVTNIDREHMDCYRDMKDVEKTFREFMDRVPFYGMVVACNDNDELRRLLPAVQRRILTYGPRKGSDFRISNVHCGPRENCSGAEQLSGQLSREYLGRIPLARSRRAQRENATAAIAVGIGLDVPVEKIREALENFNGVDRRFQLIGSADGVTVIDDYGHHPTEIRATLAAARQCGFGKVHVIFQPHRYTRTQLLLEEFATAFRDADSVLVLDIYPASEPPIPGITGELLANRISEVRRAGGALCLIVRRRCEAGGGRSQARRHDPYSGRGQRLATRAAGAGGAREARRERVQRTYEFTLGGSSCTANLALPILSLRKLNENSYSEANSRSSGRFTRFSWPEKLNNNAGRGTRSSRDASLPRPRGYDESPLDARMLDLDDEAESPFLRGQKRVPVRRGALPRKAASRLKIALLLIFALGSVALIWIALHQYATRSWRFRIDSSDNIAGLRQRQCQPLAGAGSDGERHRSQHLLRAAGCAQETTGADSVGAIGVGDAPASQPLEDRHQGAHAGRLCRDQLAHRTD